MRDIDISKSTEIRRIFKTYHRIDIPRKLFYDYFYGELQELIHIHFLFYYVYIPVYNSNHFELCIKNLNGIDRYPHLVCRSQQFYTDLIIHNIDLKEFENDLIKQSQYIKLLYC